MAIHFPRLGWKIQKLDDVVDGKLPDDLDYMSIFSKVIGDKLSNGSRVIYTRAEIISYAIALSI